MRRGIFITAVINTECIAKEISDQLYVTFTPPSKPLQTPPKAPKLANTYTAIHLSPLYVPYSSFKQLLISCILLCYLTTPASLYTTNIIPHSYFRLFARQFCHVSLSCALTCGLPASKIGPPSLLRFNDLLAIIAGLCDGSTRRHACCLHVSFGNLQPAWVTFTIIEKI